MKIFGKTIPILAIVAIVMSAGMASAALVFYLSNTVTTKVGVASPIDLKGNLTYWLAEKGFFTTSDLGTAEWSSEKTNTGEYSAKLMIPASELPATEGEEARVVFSYGGLLNDVGDITYNSYAQGRDGLYHPYVVLAVDFGDGGDPDAWIVQWEDASFAPNGEDTWIPTTFDKDSPVHVAGTRTGLDEKYVPYTTEHILTDTLGTLKNETFSDGVTWGDLTVVQIKIMIGMWPAGEAVTAYVDDVSGAVNSGFERESVDFDGEPASINIMGGSEIYMNFEATNLANRPIEAPLALIIEGPSESEWIGGEIEEKHPPTTFMDSSNGYLVLVFDQLGTIRPTATHELHIHIVLSEAIAPTTDPETYVFRAVVVWADILEGTNEEIIAAILEAAL